MAQKYIILNYFGFNYLNKEEFVRFYNLLQICNMGDIRNNLMGWRDDSQVVNDSSQPP